MFYTLKCKVCCALRIWVMTVSQFMFWHPDTLLVKFSPKAWQGNDFAFSSYIFRKYIIVLHLPNLYPLQLFCIIRQLASAVSWSAVLIRDVRNRLSLMESVNVTADTDANVPWKHELKIWLITRVAFITSLWGNPAQWQWTVCVCILKSERL